MTAPRVESIGPMRRFASLCSTTSAAARSHRKLILVLPSGQSSPHHDEAGEGRSESAISPDGMGNVGQWAYRAEREFAGRRKYGLNQVVNRILGWKSGF